MSKRIGVIFLGPPGSGKGTQAAKLAESLTIPHISTGEILRQAITEKTELGQQAQAYVEKGELVPDELLLGLIQERLKQPDSAKGWILDGFPRTVTQASFLDELLEELADSYTYVVNLSVPDTVLIERLMQRGRQDDTQETIARRLQVYIDQTAPVLDYYDKKGTLNHIDGAQSMEAVTAALTAIVTPV
jgi:adenylate kinase